MVGKAVVLAVDVTEVVVAVEVTEMVVVVEVTGGGGRGGDRGGHGRGGDSWWWPWRWWKKLLGVGGAWGINDIGG